MRGFWTIPGPQKRCFVAKNPYIAFSLRLNNSYWSLCYKLAIQPSRLDNKFAKSWLPWPLNCILMVVRSLIIERVTAWREICMLAKAVLWRFSKVVYAHIKTAGQKKKTQKQRLQGLFILNLQIILCCLWWSTSLRLVWDTVRLFQNLIHLRQIACRGRKFHISFIISWFIYHDYKSCFSFKFITFEISCNHWWHQCGKSVTVNCRLL